MKDMDQLCVDTIRTLSMDAVQAAGSGHPGAPMGMAPMAYILWRNILRYDPGNPLWPNRDRFVLSAGHASMLLYSILHLAGVRAVNEDGNPLPEPAVSLEDIRNFRQWNGKCPGHPEYGMTAGVEMTTGPLGQGVATSVGMAAAGKWLGATFNRPDFTLVDYRVFALAGDGDLMEGVSAEAASLAGHLKLDNLCWIFDSNHITIDGPTRLAVSENTANRFRACGWEVLHAEDANDMQTLAQIYDQAVSVTGKPVLIIVNSHIAWGSPNKQDSSAAHGSPLGEEEIRLTKQRYGWPEDARFRVPDGVREYFRAGIAERGEPRRKEWETLFRSYADAYPDAARQFNRILSGTLPENWDEDIPEYPADSRGMASRSASGEILNAIGNHVPWLLGGSADLAPSNKTMLKNGATVFSADDFSGRNIHFGIREHAMAAMMNGMCLSGLRPYGGTFLVFSDYSRPSIRLAALMEIPVIYVFTHDSICVGEDGPTHQPIEHLAALRAMPGLTVIRPADANETAGAWRVAMTRRRGPTALILSRQNLPTIDREIFGAAQVDRGAYILADSDGEPEIILIATGSEVALALEAWKTLRDDGIRCRVVSMPSWELFEEQPRTYRNTVLPPGVTVRLAVEAGATMGWAAYTGFRGAIIGLDRFGASAPAKDLVEQFGFTAKHVIETARDLLREP